MKIMMTAVFSIVISVVLITLIAVNSFNQAISTTTNRELEATINNKAVVTHTLLHSYATLLKALSTSSEVEDALIDFTSAFDKLSKEVKLDKAKLKDELIHDYDVHYLNKVNYDVGNNQRRLTAQYLPSSLNGKIAQKIFILDNPAKLGEKNKLSFDPKYEFISYMKVHGKYHETFNDFLKDFGLYDIFIVNIKGDVVYTTYKEKDFATNLRKDVYKLSALGRAYFRSLKAKKGDMVFEDFSYYEPSYNSQAAFIASPIYIDGKVEGSIIFQLPLDKLNEIFTKDYQGETDEVYLVGNDFKLRTELRFKDQLIPNNPLIQKAGTAVGIVEMDNQYMKEGLLGNKNIIYTKNYLGRDTIMAYSPIKIYGKIWVIVGEVSVEEATRDKTKVIKQVITVSLISMVFVSILLFILLDRFIGKPLEYIIETTTEISSGDGDLTKRIVIHNENDEFGEVSHNMNYFIEQMQNLINKVKDLSDKNMDVANSINQVSTNITDRIKAENKTLSLISETGKTISNDLKETASNIKETKEMIVDSNNILNDAKNEISQLAKKVNEASESQKNLSTKLSNLSENAEKIKEVLFVIDDIADQTNLLALNAAIEAARAGEFGKGFAVVAFEVTKLADKTQESLADVNKIVSIVLDEMKEAVKLMSKSAQSISELAVVSSDANRRITDTSETIENSTKIIEKTVKNAVDAATKTSEIIEKIQRITKMSNENMANVQELLHKSETLNESGSQLNKTLGYYKS
jgi:methyl-accepting chemotaxis protein